MEDPSPRRIQITLEDIEKFCYDKDFYHNFVDEVTTEMAHQVDIKCFSDAFDYINAEITRLEHTKPITKKGKEKQANNLTSLHVARFSMEQYINCRGDYFEALF